MSTRRLRILLPALTLSALGLVILEKQLDTALPTLEGATLQSRVTTPTILFSAEEAAEEIELSANVHNIFSCEGEDAFPLFSNALEQDERIRFWVYEYKGGGKEPPFNGRFLISNAEIAAHPKNAERQKLTEFVPGKKYYVMTEKSLLFQCDSGLRSIEECGNAIQEEDEECDEGENNGVDTCSAECTEISCGDGRAEGTEQCDDCNADNDDGCTESCTVEDAYECPLNEAGESDCTPLIPTLNPMDSFFDDAESDDGDHPAADDEPAAALHAEPMEEEQEETTETGGFYDDWCTLHPEFCPGFTPKTATPPIKLQSIVLSCGLVTVNYTKTFDACAHLLNTQNVLLHGSNFFCGRGGVLAFPTQGFVRKPEQGMQVKLCNGTNYQECSTATVTGDESCS